MADIEKGASTQIPNSSTTANNGQPWDPSRAHSPRQASRIANPAALGLFSFASTTFLLSMINVNTRGIHTPNVVVGMAIFTGGLAQLLAGMWEFPRGNVFGGTAFTSYGAFWMSYATILIPSSGVIASYGTNQSELASALGLYLMVWFMFTFLLMFGAIRRNIAFTLLLGFLSLTFLLLACGEWSAKVSVVKAGGALGIVTAFIAYYCAVSELMIKEESYFMLPLGAIRKRDA